MKISRGAITKRGLENRCPNCGEKSLFRTRFNINSACPHCGLVLDRGEGFWLGSMSIMYGATLFLCLAPIALLWYFEILSDAVAAVLAGIGALVFPVLIYRSARSWWLMFYYLALPHELPKNRTEAVPVDDEWR